MGPGLARVDWGSLRTRTRETEEVRASSRYRRSPGARYNTHQTEEVQPSVSFLRALAALDNDFILVELLLFDRHIDLDDVLPDNATSANVQVTIK